METFDFNLFTGPIANGALKGETVIKAYELGLFPMPDDNGILEWCYVDERYIIPIDENFKVPKNLKKLFASHKFQCTINQNFEAVIHNCTKRDHNWIDETIIKAYTELHQMGKAMSVEVYLNNELVGGLYGIAHKRLFYGESMFHTVSNASKIALLHLVIYLREQGYFFIDSQIYNPHYDQFGGFLINKSAYDAALKLIMSEKIKPPKYDPYLNIMP